jgi:hypothetical protein
MTMNTGLSRIEWTGLAGTRGGFWTWSQPSSTTFFNFGFVWLPAVLIAALGAWMLLFGSAGNRAASQASERVQATTVAAMPAPLPVVAPAQVRPPLDSATTPLEAIAPEQPMPVDGLRISSQYWRRGGLGSNALVTLTLRNNNAYAVKDIAIACAFARRDGSHLTDRTRTIHDIVNMKSRKTFARLHIGFVNINVNRAKCSPVAASHV